MIDLHNRKVRRLAICAGISLLGVGGFGYAGYQSTEDTAALEEESQSLRGRISSAKSEIALISRLEERVLRLRAQVQGQVRILPDDAEINDFVDKLTEFADDAGVAVNKLDDTAVKARSKGRRGSKEAFEAITYKLEFVAGAPQLLAFLDRFENEYERFVRIRNFRIRADGDVLKRMTEDGDAVAQHSVTMELETYVYNPKAQGSDQVRIPDEERKLGALIAAGKIDGDSGDIVIDRYDLVADKPRRDPFVDPRIQKSADDAAEEERRVLETDQIEALLAELAKARDLMSKEDAKKDNKVRLLQAQEMTDIALRTLGERISRLEDEEFFRVEDTRERFAIEVAAPIGELLRERGAVVLDPQARIVNELQHYRERIRRAASRKDYDLVVTVATEAESLRELGQGSREVEELLAAIDHLRREAQVVTEFGQLDLKYGGSIIRRGDAPRSVVILNGKSFRAGDQVQPELKLLEIKREAIVFEFRGFEVSRHLNSK